MIADGMLLSENDQKTYENIKSKVVDPFSETLLGID